MSAARVGVRVKGRANRNSVPRKLGSSWRHSEPTRLRADIEALVIANCEARVLRGEEVPMADKKLSVSDPDAGFIAKGQRQPVIA